MGLKQLNIHMQKNESRHRAYTLPKNSLKMDHRPQYKTIKLESNVEKILDDLGYDNDFLDKTLKA